jgi:hypothetical protein
VAAYAKAHGLMIVREFYDAAVSGADQIDQRPGDKSRGAHGRAQPDPALLSPPRPSARGRVPRGLARLCHGPHPGRQ